ncbi:adenylate/guanylate cyclase domain-containing protein [Ruegeria sp. ANG-R]|uniref:adenylate/guanylate cyclase domain-containing protein n=1 Tax=Ruegeria sp. ANG-R TaxID=1577903 RepID=UPI000AB84D85|nr:adenylate/guanylate cyclase domain-containing protein [Ruegeria sp. ANG-R]
MTPSSELLAVSRRWFKTNLEGGQYTPRNFLSDSDFLRLLGTAPGENWSGDDVREAAAEFFQETPDVLHYEESFAEAFEDGDIGWSLFIHKVTWAGRADRPVEIRDTLIFYLEDGSWRIIHRHGSVPMANQEMMGKEQTGIAELAEAARHGTSIEQTEGLASIMFTDVVASSVLANTLGDRAWSAKVNSHFKKLRQIIESSGGQFVKSLGDGTMSSFSSARSALSAAAEIQQTLAQESEEPRLAARIGIHAGDVVQASEDFFGTVVNVAARIAAEADRGEIFVSDVTRWLVGDDPELRFETLGSYDLQGQPERSVLHSLDWRS